MLCLHPLSNLLCVVVAFSVAAVIPEPVSDNPPVGWRKDGLAVDGTWQQDPVSGAWSVAPVNQPDDPNGYRYEPVCTDSDGNVDVQCRVRYDGRCEDGEDGELVQWFTGLRELGSSAWDNPIGGLTCIYSEEPMDVLDEIAGRILSEFRKLPVEAGAINLQPSPHTLIGADTNVYVEAEEQSFDIDLLGQDVSIDASPIEFTWNYGDGTSLGPVAEPGGPLPAARWGERTATSHAYAQTGDFSVSLTTTFSGTYSVNGGPAIPIPGTGTFTAAPVTISVWRSVVNNYADNCLENPNGAGC